MTNTMKDRTIAKRYGGALFALASEIGGEDELFLDMEKLRKTAELEPFFLKAISDERIPFGKRVRISEEIAGVLGLGNVAKNFLKLAVSKKRTSLIPFIADDLIARVEKKRRVAVSEAWVANKSSLEEVKRNISAIIGKILGTKAVCSANVNEELIGGFVVKLGDVLYDASIAGKISKMRETILGISTKEGAP